MHHRYKKGRKLSRARHGIHTELKHFNFYSNMLNFKLENLKDNLLDLKLL